MCILSDADLNSIADKQRENRRAQREADAQVGGQDSQGDYDMFGLDVQPPFNQALLDMPHLCQTIGGNVPVFQLSPRFFAAGGRQHPWISSLIKI